jgi:hypothetical protein
MNYRSHNDKFTGRAQRFSEYYRLLCVLSTLRVEFLIAGCIRLAETQAYCSSYHIPLSSTKVTDTDESCRVLDGSAHLLSRALVSQSASVAYCTLSVSVCSLLALAHSGLYYVGWFLSVFFLILCIVLQILNTKSYAL